MSNLEWVRRDGVGRWEAESGGGGSSPSTATATVTANQGNGYSTSHTFDLGSDGPHPAEITLTGLTLTGDGETFGNAPGTIYAGPNSSTTHLQSSADGLVFGNVNSNEIGPQGTDVGGATFEVQSTSVTAKAVLVAGRYLKVPVAIVANDTGDIYAGANQPSAQVRIDLRYL